LKKDAQKIFKAWDRRNPKKKELTKEEGRRGRVGSPRGEKRGGRANQ